MDVDFIVRTHREGTIDTNKDIEAIVTKMGQTCFQDTAIGSVAAIVESDASGTIIKNKLRWEGDPIFEKNQRLNADALLIAVTAAIKGAGGGDDLKVKIKTKM